MNPEVPPALAALVDRLLEKDKARRPQDTGEVVAALDLVSRELSGEQTWPEDLRSLREQAGGSRAMATAAGGTEVLRPHPNPSPEGEGLKRDSRRLGWLAAALLVLALAGWGAYRWWAPPRTLSVAVPLTVATDAGGQASAAHRIAASAVHTGLLRTLLALRPLAVREPNATEAALDPKTLARAMATEEVLTSKLECEGDRCQVQLRRVRGADGSLLWARRFAIAADDLLALSSSVAEQARQAFPDFEPRSGGGTPQVRSADYARYLELLRRFQIREQGVSYEALLADLTDLQRSSPRFLGAVILEARIARFHFVETRDAGALARALAAVRRAAELAPEDTGTLRTAFDVYLEAGRLDEAAQALDRAEKQQPDDAGLLALRAALLERRGDIAEAQTAMQEAVKREPSYYHLTQLSDLEYQAGDIGAARKHLEMALERSPGRYDGLSRLAQLELSHGDARRALRIYESLVARFPGEAELTNLGAAYVLTGRYAEAERRFRQILALSPESPVALLNLADVTTLRGHREAAAALYSQVLARLASDPDPDALPLVRAQALAHLGRAEEAVAAIQQAQRLDPEDPQTHYASALVFALLGDDASAVWNARRALDGGMDRRWFALPWFDAVLRQIDR